MKGLVSVDEVMAALPKDRREAIETLGAELIAKVRRRMTLGELRKGRKLSQATMAQALGIGQMQISRLEQRKDPRLSTMQRAVAAMGGSLTLIATFPDQEPVVLTPSRPIEEKRTAKKRVSVSSKKAVRKQAKANARA